MDTSADGKVVIELLRTDMEIVSIMESLALVGWTTDRIIDAMNSAGVDNAKLIKCLL